GGMPVLDAATLAALDDNERSDRIAGYVVAAMSAVLGLRNGSIDAGTSINTLGFDSLMAMELRNRIESDLGILLPVATLLQAETLSTIATALDERVPLGTAPVSTDPLESFEF